MSDFEPISEDKLNKVFIKKKLNIDCKCRNENIYIDIQNKRIECAKCGAILDPFDVVYRLFYQEERYMERIKFLRQQCEELEKWLLNNRMGSALREIAREIRQGKVPSCPHCRKPFDLEKINSWWSKEYAEAQFQQEFLNSVKEQNNEKSTKNQRK